MRREDIHENDIFVIHDFITPAECTELIAVAEAAGFGDAPINTGFGTSVRKDFRNNQRVMIDDVGLADQWIARAAPFFPPRIGGWEPCGLNERFRYYRYEPGQKFDWHQDAAFHRTNGETSALTFMVYLNDCVAGGCTAFNLRRDGAIRTSDSLLRIQPTAGKALVFRHDLLHTGEVVLEDVKYVVRSDVMCRRRAEY